MFADCPGPLELIHVEWASQEAPEAHAGATTAKHRNAANQRLLTASCSKHATQVAVVLLAPMWLRKHLTRSHLSTSAS